MLSQLLKSKETLENADPEANCEKTTMKPKHIDLEAILENHFGLILGYLGGLWGPSWASWSQLEPT